MCLRKKSMFSKQSPEKFKSGTVNAWFSQHPFFFVKRNKMMKRQPTVIAVLILRCKIDTVLQQHWAYSGQVLLGSQMQRRLSVFGHLIYFGSSKQLESGKKLLISMICTAMSVPMHKYEKGLRFTRLRTMISEPACTARWRGVSLAASWTLELTLAWTLIKNRTLSMSEFWTATCRKFLPLLSTWREADAFR